MEGNQDCLEIAPSSRSTEGPIRGRFQPPLASNGRGFGTHRTGDAGIKPMADWILNNGWSGCHCAEEMHRAGLGQ
jgi:hypothetical protein